MEKKSGKKMMMKHWAFIFLVILCSGCGNPPKPKPLPRVIVGEIEKRDLPIYIDAIGQALSPVTVQIRPQVAGKLLSVHFEEGDIVKEGDILYTVDPRPYQALLDEANAQLKHDLALLEYAESAVTRYKKIVDEDFISVLTFENYLSNAEAARGQVEQSRAAVRSAQLNVEFCNIVAPVSGKVSYYFVDIGNIVAVDDPTAITSIKPFSPIDIQFSLPQQQFEMIRAEQGNEGKWKFFAVLPEQPDKKFESITNFLDNQVDQNTGTILLKGSVDNKDWHFWPGEFIKVKVLYKIAEGALIVPPGAVLMGKSGPYLYTLDAEGLAAVHQVTVLTRTDEYIAISSPDLYQGNVIVIDGQINIAPGMKVEVPEKVKR